MDYTTFLTPAIGATGLLALVIIMILRGLLIPRSTMDMIVSSKDLQIEIWKAAAEKSQEIQEIQRQQISVLVEATKTTTHVMQAIPQAISQNEGSHRALAPEE